MTVMSSVQGLSALSPEAVPEPLRYAIVESAAEIRFVAVEPAGLAALLQYPRGIAFGETAELRWMRRRAGWHAVYISDAGHEIAGAMRRREVTASGEPMPPYLRGTKTNVGGDEYAFLHGRIPGPIEYPFGDEVKAGEIPSLRVQHYEGGPAGLCRLVGRLVVR